jgi:hypothetical protein
MSKARIEGFEKQKELLIKLMYNNAPRELSGMVYSDMPGGSKNYMSLDRIVDRIEKLDSALYIESSLLENMENTKGKIDGRIQNLQGIKYKVAYLREIEGKSYKEIAADLNMSEDRIKHIGAEIKKERNN